MSQSPFTFPFHLGRIHAGDDEVEGIGAVGECAGNLRGQRAIGNARETARAVESHNRDDAGGKARTFQIESDSAYVEIIRVAHRGGGVAGRA